MDVSYSVWRDTAADKQEVSGESFSFLFDRRYSNRLNRMSRVFFEAYAKATSEVSAEEDRFPSLSEIESRMESGAIYAYKDRLMRSTGFFEEVKISGISYLIPKARRFVDVTGTYTDLILDLEKGEVVLPKREKPSAIPRPEGAEPEEETPELASIEEEQEGEEEEEVEEEEDLEPSSEEAAIAVEAPQAVPEEKPPEMAADTMAETPLTTETESEKRPPDESTTEIASTEPDREIEAPKAIEPTETSPLKVETEVVGPKEETEAPKKESPIETKEPISEMGKRGEVAKAAETERPSPSAEWVRAKVPASKPHRPEKKPEKGIGGWGRDRKGPIMALAGLALITVLAGFYIWSPSTQDEPATPTEPSDYVSYSAYLTNASENTYLNLEVTNPKGLESKVELVLPPDVDKSISATGGIVTISYTNNTVIQLTSSNNASVSVALTDEYVLVPVTFNLAIPQGYESSVLVYDKDYQVSRTNSTISLWCNCTEDHLDFDQIYNAKKVSGGPGPQEGSPANDTANMSAGSSGPEPKDDI
jgi:hypothetical protein